MLCRFPVFVCGGHTCVPGDPVYTHSGNALVAEFPCVPRHLPTELSMTEKEGRGGCLNLPAPLSSHPLPHHPTPITPLLTTPPVNSPSTLRFLSRERLLFLTLSSSFSLRSCSAWASKSLFLRRCLAACAMALVARAWAVLARPGPTALVCEATALGLLPGAGRH